MDPKRNQNNDVVVILATISNFWVKKVLVDCESSVVIIFYDAYVQLESDSARQQKVNSPLTSFSGEMIEPLEEVMLTLSLDFYTKRFTEMVKFLVVKTPFTNNIILQRLSLNLVRAVTSTLNMKLKFHIPDGMAEAVGDE
ncbi:UNVERIFIED_CONTAM: hypothetical protein Slati_0005400 [Sesamum latifolium]|uniref:Uncharacterized protein n=1 Tax=Sesamum latifolium TaxID=2727402 RepID=A0AAW2Y5U8_9LAMI